jgi:ribosomal subunit interface protein
MLPIQITLRDLPSSDAVEEHIRKRADKLNRFYDRISSCRIVIETPQKHKHQGKLYNVRIDITIPGKELAVTRKCDQDIYVAIRDAFDALERQLEEHSNKQHGKVKTHDSLMRGYVARLISNEGYGFIDGADGNEYYFSITNVSHPSFDQLVVGDLVEYVAQPLNDGWQAHHVIRARNNER